MKLEFQGETFSEVLTQMVDFLSNLNIDILPDSEEVPDEAVPEVPEEKPVDKKSEPKQASPKPDPKKDGDDASEDEAPVPEKEPERDPAADKQEAIDILMKLYNDGKSADVKDLLKDFGVKKFGEIEDERGSELLDRANDLCKEAA